jgi:hypothetical protein
MPPSQAQRRRVSVAGLGRFQGFREVCRWVSGSMHEGSWGCLSKWQADSQTRRADTGACSVDTQRPHITCCTHLSDQLLPVLCLCTAGDPTGEYTFVFKN